MDVHRWRRCCARCVIHGGAAAADASRAFTPTDLNTLARVSDPQVSPNGRYVVYVQRETDFEANRGRNDLWLVDLRTPAPKPRRLTQHSANDTNPRWAPDGASIYFLSSRAGSHADLAPAACWAAKPCRSPTTRSTSARFRFSPTTASASRSAMDVFTDCADLKCTRDTARCRRGEQGHGSLLRRPVRASLGHLARSHPLEPVRGPGAPDGRAGAPVNVSRRARCRCAIQARRRRRGIHFSAPTASTWCSARGSPAARKRGRRTSTCTRSPVRRRRRAERISPPTIPPGTRSRCS